MQQHLILMLDFSRSLNSFFYEILLKYISTCPYFKFIQTQQLLQLVAIRCVFLMKVIRDIRAFHL